MHISNSMMTTAKQCWKKYEWRYLMNLEPIEQRQALNLGKVVHAALEMYYKGFKDNEIIAYIDAAFNESRAKVEVSEVEDVDIAHAIAKGMWLGFQKDKDTFQEMQSEKKFSVPFKTRGVKYGLSVDGIMDGLAKKDNRWWVRETKTTSLNRRQFKERMDVSEQASMYVWAARKLGFDVQGVMYDGIHKPLLRKGVNESTSAFCDRIVKDYCDPSRREMYYQREYVYRSPVDIKHFETDLNAFRKDLIEKSKGGCYRNHNSCVAFNSDCQYRRICFDEKPDILTLQLFYKQRETDRKEEVKHGKETE